MESRSNWATSVGEDPNRTPEQRLALAKLAQMVRDLFKVGCGEANQADANQRAARYWFFEEGDLEFWCEMAGYDPTRVIIGMKHAYLAYRDGNQDIVKRMLLKWRAAPGEGLNYQKRKDSRERKTSKILATKKSGPKAALSRNHQ